MKIFHFAVHEIIKQQHENDYKKIESLEEGDINDPHIIKLVESIDEQFSGSKNKNKSYGKFKKNEKEMIGSSLFSEHFFPVFYNDIESIISKSQITTFDNDARSLLSIIINKPASSGGYIFYILYAAGEPERNYCIVCMLKNVIDVSVSFSKGKPVVKDIERLNLKDLDIACRIDINDVLYLIKKDNEKTSPIIFLTRNKKNKYFADFIGCDDFLTPEKNSDNLMKVIEQYGSEQGLESSEMAVLKNRVTDYIKQKKEAKEDIDIYEISELITDQKDDSIIKEVAQRVGIKIDDYFSPIPRRFEDWSFVNFKSNIISTLKFNEEFLTRDIFRFDQDCKSVTIFDEELAKQISRRIK